MCSQLLEYAYYLVSHNPRVEWEKKYAYSEQGATTLIWKSRTWVELFFLANRLTLHDEVTYAHVFTTLLIEKEKKKLPQTGHSTYTHSLGIEI